jgi:hypothetical protein
MNNPNETELESNRRMGLEVREKIESSSEEERIELLNELYSKWEHKGDTILDYLKVALDNFGLDIGNLRLGNFEKAYKLCVFESTYLHLVFMQDKMSIEDIDNEDCDLKTIKMKFNKIFASIVDAENAIRTSLFLQSSMSEQEYVQDETNVELYRFAPMNYTDMSPYQKLLIFLLEQLHRKGYRRYNGECYKQIFTKDGYDTHSWRSAMSIKAFIHDLTDNMNINPEMWKNQTQSKSNVAAAAEYLTEYIGGEFEDISRDRHVFSFNNGIYIIKKYNEEKDIYYDEWIPYSGPGSKSIGSSVVACKYFNEDFHYKGEMKWFDVIKKYCPHFVGIMTYQEWPEDVQKWLCIMIGRNMYNLGELEEWQVLAYLLGQAGSGKSYARDTKVLCFDGSFCKVQDLKKGDILMGDDSKPRNVLSCTAGVDMMYKVKQKHGIEYVVNGLHELVLKVSYDAIINEHKYEQGDIVEINVENYLKLDNLQKNALKGYKVKIEFEEKQLSLDPYLVGRNLLKEYKQIPNIYKINSSKNRLKLLAGILDENGCYDRIEIDTTNKELIQDIEYVICSLGFNTKIITNKKKYTICIYGNVKTIPTNIKQYQELYNKHHTTINDLTTDIVISKHEVDYFYGVQLDGNHRLVLEDFTVAHNSTILTKIVKQIYEPCDVGVLSNNIEKKFGLSALAEKFMFVGPEIKGNLALEQSEFQSLISGEDIQVAEKHKIAKSIVWTVPGMLAGNEVPSYTDNAGSVSRRLMVFKFDQKVSSGDTRLGSKLIKEITYIIQACNRGYQEAVNTHGDKDVWNCVPEYFKKTKDSMAENTNALMNFMNSDKVKIGEGLYVRERLFISTFNEHCRDNHLGSHKWCSDYYLGPFSSNKITSKKGKQRYPNVPGARTYPGTFIYGIDIVSDLDDDNTIDDPEN